jgi:hypothetical protein
MKVFARGNFYVQNADASRSPDTMYRAIGSAAMPSRSLVEYAVATPGIHTAIMGIGHIDQESKNCQLTQNLSASQVASGSLAGTDRRAIEAMAGRIKGGMTNNAFQNTSRWMSGPQQVTASQEMRGGRRVVQVSWHSALAGIDPIAEYEIIRGTVSIGRVPHKPQTSKAPFVFEDSVDDRTYHRYQVVAIDAMGQRMPANDVSIDSIAV